MKISKIALKAHNQCKEDASLNELYNKANKLGSFRERSILMEIAEDKADFRRDPKLIKLNRKDLIGAGHEIE